MPELPEVEVISRSLREGGRGGMPIVGRRFRDVQVLWPRSVERPPLGEFLTRLTGQEIQNVGRRAKFIVLSLSQDYLIIHLRMSGDIRVEQEFGGRGKLIPPGKHVRVNFSLDKNLRMVFEDARKFGRVWLVADLEEFTANIGPEPLEPTFTPMMFYEQLHKRHRQLKPLLMDQSFLAGLGNIYTDEALHLAGLHPRIKSDHITKTQAEFLLDIIRRLLLEAIEQNGTSIDWVYRGGNFQNNFRVYQRTGEPCLNCGNPIKRILVGQRGTHYCPVCQPI